jgi:hypothetical protein
VKICHEKMCENLLVKNQPNLRKTESTPSKTNSLGGKRSWASASDSEGKVDPKAPSGCNQLHTRAVISFTLRAAISRTPGLGSAAHQGHNQPHTRAAINRTPVPQSAAHQGRDQPHTLGCNQPQSVAPQGHDQLHTRAAISCTPGPRSAPHQGHNQPHAMAGISHTPGPRSAAHQGH